MGNVQVEAFLQKHTKKTLGIESPYVSTACREFIGWKKAGGYGQVRVRGRIWLAHRYVWFLLHGGFEKPCVCHTCDNPPCCNPDHLWNGTNQENIKDRSRKGRTTRSGPIHPVTGDKHWTHTHPEKLVRGDRHWTRLHPDARLFGDKNGSRLHPESMPRGENHANSKATEVIVREIRKRYCNRHYPHPNSVGAMAKEFGISVSAIRRIAKGETW